MQAFFSCNMDNHLTYKMEQIKKVGDTNQTLAFAMMDSIRVEVEKADEHTRMKYDLLLLRINDKAYVVPTSDIMSRQVTAYFAKHGSEAEKQEAYYYNGSVYRDLRDAPRAIENFLKSVEIATFSDKCDSLMLRNAYSNLHSLFFSVQDYTNGLAYAKKEYELSHKINNMSLDAIMHLGLSYSYMDSTSQAIYEFVEAEKFIRLHNDYDKDWMPSLLLCLSHLGEKAGATSCYNLMKEHVKPSELNASDYLSLGEYFQMKGEEDSAISCYRHVISMPMKEDNIYDASKFLFEIYDSLKNTQEAIKYARVYVNASDSLDLGKRQEMAATVNNQFMYHYDKHKEELAREKVTKYHYLLVILLIAILLIVVTAIAIHIFLRNKNLKKTMALTRELDSLKNDRNSLQSEIDIKVRELEHSRLSLHDASSELDSVKEKLAEVNEELAESKVRLKESEVALSEKLDQHEAIIRLLHKTEFEVNADDVIYAVRQSADGSKKLSASEWRQLYHAVDELYPDFKKLIVQKLGNFTEQQIQLCYLMRIGLTKPQIQNITNIPHVTVWRWSKKFSWASEQ
ncbi:hypothetical protein PRLR5107_07650 [Prevotella lacticifex]|uniref:Tetratricopeptide repeat protein n=2 Tax=Prevotella lacticifex TaxID=2854755 RepID=A0A9R1C943_9BACT|nr:hypothetical protein PRLR5003_02060 [Prevotella lacticifex]GJG39900.1 hypothetical protein PRLR5019_18710 [Prevotella lacticifex]GJG41418.1 hypothetical protein PRLR5025_02040 [Prevotella lacticifex]GJG46254.1 hypothetical protein PRLR5027_18490 [Prevotella lacticifex]GJG47770.1 hypothetical protein PRLR5052_01830 [Prevotella lacticifex]